MRGAGDERTRRGGRTLARAACFVLAALGALPFVAALVLHVRWLDDWAAARTQAALRARGVVARYSLRVGFAPLAIDLRDVRVESTDGGPPALVAPRITARPRLAALLSGELALASVEADAPRLRLVVRDGEVKNLDLARLTSSGGAATVPKPDGARRAPFRFVSATDAAVDLDLGPVRLAGDGIDVDAFAEGDPRAPPQYDVRVAGERLDLVHETRGATYEDALCGLFARVFVRGDTVSIVHLGASGAADLDTAAGTRPSCALPASDVRHVELEVREATIALPSGGRATPRLAGHVHARAPVALAERTAGVRETGGWLAADLDVRYDEAHPLPQLEGHIDGQGLVIGQFHVARTLAADVALDGDTVTSREVVASIGGGRVTIHDVQLRPLASRAPVRARVDVDDVGLAPLLQDLGVTAHPHVVWRIRRARVPELRGTLAPFALDGDMTARTTDFAVYDDDFERPKKKRVIGVASADLAAHLALTKDGLEFRDARARLPHGTAEGGYVGIGFHGTLDVEVPRVDADLVDATPLATLPIAGAAHVSLAVHGPIGHPVVTGGAAIERFVFAGAPLGDVDSVRFTLEGTELSLEDLGAHVGKSAYELPSLRIGFHGDGGIEAAGIVQSRSLALADLFALGRLESDPLLARVSGTIVDGRADVRIAVGGPKDACRAGALRVRAHTRVRDLSLFGEPFEEGDVDFDVGWPDRGAGVAGLDLDVTSFALRKPAGRGVIFGSGAMKDGAFDARAIVQSLPFTEVASLGDARRAIQGNFSADLAASGTLAAPRFLADVRTTPVRIRGVPFGPSRAHLSYAAEGAPPAPPPARVAGAVSPASALLPNGGAPRCAPAAPRPAPDVRPARLVASADLAGGEVHVPSLVLTGGDDPTLRGLVVLQDLDVDAVVQALRAEPTQAILAKPSRVQGALSGTLEIASLPLRRPETAEAAFVPTRLDLSYQDGTAYLRRVAPLALAHDTLTIPELELDVVTPSGRSTTASVRGKIDAVSRAPAIDLELATPDVDLGALVGIVPQVERASGRMKGAVSIEGPIAAPRVSGAVRVRDGALTVSGVPGELTALSADFAFDPGVLRLRSAHARLGGGSITASGSMPLGGPAVGQARITAGARDVSLALAPGVAGTFDGTFDVELDAQRIASGDPGAMRVTGDVVASGLSYTRPVNLTTDITSVGERAVRRRPTAAEETYDPAKDTILFTLGVRLRDPVRVRNDLADVHLEVAGDSLVLRGSSQRIALLGALRALPGGRMRLRGADFDVREATIRFDDPLRLRPSIDVVATTEYRRSAMAGPSFASAGALAPAGGPLRVTLHAFGDVDDLDVALSSDPPLAQEDIALLLAVGLTRAELDLMQAQAGAFTQTAAFEALASVSGADRLLRQTFPIDDFRFGSGWNGRVGRIEPEVTIGKRLSRAVGASISTGIGEDRALRSNIEWRVARTLSVEATYDNVAALSSSLGNVGGNLRWRFDFR